MFVPVYEDAAAAAAAAAAKDEKKFTQEEVNSFVAKERKTIQDKTNARIAELEAIRDSSNLKGEELERLNTQITDMQNEFKSKEQLATEERDRIKKEADKEKTKLLQEKDTWQQRYTQMVLDNSIIQASVETEAFNPEQIVAILKPNSRLVEINKTGQYETRVKFKGLDSEGKEVELDLSPKEIVKKMSEMDKYSNLFKTTAKGGLGVTDKARGAGMGDLKNLDNYKKNRDKLKGK